MKKFISALLCTAMLFTLIPEQSAYATNDVQDNSLCEHHINHDENCGYAEAVEASECQYECTECNHTVLTCTCETDDPNEHATFCALYEAPENPQCYCSEKCTEETLNVWCHICGLDGADACKAAEDDTAAVYTDEVSYIKYSWDGSALSSQSKTVASYTEITASTSTLLKESWYVVRGNVTVNQSLSVEKSTVNIILMDGATLNAKQGIKVDSGYTLNIYAQSNGSNRGKITVPTHYYGNAGIGASDNKKACGTINIHGGALSLSDATEYYLGGLGNGHNGSGGLINIYSGSVTVTATSSNAGVYLKGGTMNIYGGTVNIKSSNGYYIGFVGGDLKLYGGNCTVQGGGYNGSAAIKGTVTVKGGNLKLLTYTSTQDLVNGTTTDGTNTVSLVSVTLTGASSGEKIVAFYDVEGNPISYDTNDMTTMDTNKLYMYLPDDHGLTYVETEKGVYTLGTSGSGEFTHTHSYTGMATYEKDTAEQHTVKRSCESCPVNAVQISKETHIPGSEYTQLDDNQHSTSCTACGEDITESCSAGRYSSAENVITDQCISCPRIVGTATITADDKVYDGTEASKSMETSGTLVEKEITVTYQKDNDILNGAPSDVGSYTVSIEYGGVSAKDAFEITAKSLEESMVSVSATGLVYDGSEKTPTVTIIHNEMPLVAGKDYEVLSCTNNINATTETSKASVTIKGIGNYSGTVTKEFTIAKASVTASEFTFTAPADRVYDGNAKEASVTANKTGIGEITVKYYYDDNPNDAIEAPVNAGKYAVKILVTESDNYEAAEELTATDWTFTIDPKEIGIIWSETENLKYTGESLVPTAEATNLVTGDTYTLTTFVADTADGAGKIPGTWTAQVTALSNSNYKLPENATTSFTIINADQDKPEITSANETIDNKNDGTISGVTTAMEYRLASDSNYTAITETMLNNDTLENLSDGTYYVRYSAKQYYNESPDAVVTINAGNKLKVNIPETQNGYTLEVTESEVSWNGSSIIKFTLKNGYSETNAFAIKVNNVPVTLDTDGNYTISNIQENQTITVEGVADITAPTAEIGVKENKWNSFFNGLTFGIFFKETQEVTITAEDVNTGSGLDKVYYYLSSEELTEDAVKTLGDWVEYTAPFNINPDKEYIIYAKATDKAGNTIYINSNGLVLDATAPVITGIENGGTYYSSIEFGVTESCLDTVTLDGTTITLDADGKYTIIADDQEHTIVATDKATNSNATMKIKVATIASIDDAIENITTSNVKSSDKEAIKEILEIVESLQDSGKDFTDAEDTKLAEIESNAKALLNQIKKAEDAADNESTGKVDNINSGNVTTSDKGSLSDAKETLEQALQDYSNNYTEAEQEAINADIQRINAALESIEKVENATSKITNLPSSVEPDDLETVAKIEEAKSVYDALTDHEKSLISAEDKEKLASLLSQAVDYKIVEGNGSSIREDSNGTLRFKVNGAYSKFTGIKVDNNVIDAQYYTVEAGSTIITLTNGFLDKLSVGTHSLTVVYTDGEATGNFTITAKPSSSSSSDDSEDTSSADTSATTTPVDTQVKDVPPTGDESNIAFYLTTLLLAGIGLILLTVIPRRKRN